MFKQFKQFKQFKRKYALRGQALVLVALIIPVLFLLAGVGLDLG